MGIPGVPERKGEGMKTGGAGFFAGRRENTELLAAAIARQIESRFGKMPFFVIAKAQRKFVDANRPPEIGVEHPRAREVCDAYRGTLAKFCDDVQTRFGRDLRAVHCAVLAAQGVGRRSARTAPVELVLDRSYAELADCERFVTKGDTLVGYLLQPGRGIASADLTEVVVQSGHWMAQEKPHDVNAALTKWLSAKFPALWPK